MPLRVLPGILPAPEAEAHGSDWPLSHWKHPRNGAYHPATRRKAKPTPGGIKNARLFPSQVPDFPLPAVVSSKPFIFNKSPGNLAFSAALRRWGVLNPRPDPSGLT